MPRLYTDEEIARLSVSAIVDDLTDRRGLKQEWDQIDEVVKAEIISAWEGYILRTIQKRQVSAFALMQKQ